MKKIIILVLLVGMGYKGYTEFVQKGAGAFDEQGQAQVLLFTVDGCGNPCSDANTLLTGRDVTYEEVVVTDGDEQLKRWERHGAIRTMPVLVVGNERISGFHKWKYISTLAVNYETDYLTPYEAKIFSRNFKEDGSPKLVMYTMDGCGYCETAMRQLREDGIAFEERNTSADYAAKSELDLFQAGTPLIFYGYRRFEGWSNDVYKSLKGVL